LVLVQVVDIEVVAVVMVQQQQLLSLGWEGRGLRT
jgi:hypothetical protein